MLKTTSKIIHTSTTGHTVKAIKVEKISNGALVVHLRCCDDPTTDHPHTIYRTQVVNGQVVHGDDKTAVDASLIKVASELVAPDHEAMNATHKYLMENFVDEPKAPETTMTLKD